MPLRKDWQELKEISSLKRAAENPPPFTTKQDRKALKVEAQALARQETAKQWDIRAQATEFLKQHGYTSGAKKQNAPNDGLIEQHNRGEHISWKRRCPLCKDSRMEAEIKAGWDPNP